MIVLILPLALLCIHSIHSADIAGDWGPWEADPDIDCCMYGGYDRVQRYCNNPTPEGSGSKCVRNDNSTGDLETQWRTCNCECIPPCDVESAFCANDTGAAAHCVCNYGYVFPPGYDPNNVTACQAPVVTEAPAEAAKEPTTMDAKDASKIIQMITCIWLLLWLVAIVVVFFIFWNFRPERVIHMNEEITLFITHLLVATLVEEADSEGLCKFVSICLHYFFMCAMVFFCLEALHSYSIVTYVVPTKGYLHTFVNLGIGYGFPILPLAISLAVLYNKYGTSLRHCWCSIETGQGWGFLVPIIFLGFICTVIAEAQGQGSYKELPDADKSTYTSARVSQGSIMIIMPLSLVSYIFGLLAVDLQNVYLYSIFAILNFILGPVIFIFHCMADPRVRALLAKILPCLREDRPRSGKVAPSPDAGMHATPPTPSQGPGVGPPPPDDAGKPDPKDTDWQNFYKWVTDGKRENINQAENVLFKPVAK